MPKIWKILSVIIAKNDQNLFVKIAQNGQSLSVKNGKYGQHGQNLVYQPRKILG